MQMIETKYAQAGYTMPRVVFWNRRYEPACIARDKSVKEALRADGIEAESFNAALLHEPWTIQNQSGKPFQVFTPFWRALLSRPEPDDSRGLGLVGMQERVGLLSGRIQIESTEGSGTTLVVEVPLT